MNYKSQRLSLSYPAIERLKQVYDLPADTTPVPEIPEIPITNLTLENWLQWLRNGGNHEN